MRSLPILSAFAYVAFGFASNLLSQVPEGGLMLNAETGTTYQQIGQCTLTEVPVEGMSFTSALQLTTEPDIPNSWNAQVKFPAVAGVEAGDVVLITFYARTLESIEETGAGLLTVCIEHNTTYAKEIYYNISIGQEWQEYYAPVQIQNPLLASEANYSFHIGFSSQTIEVAEARFLNYLDALTLEDLPVTEITYAGQAPDASWREPAVERINLYRKGEARITVVDSEGQVVPDASVSIEMIRHQFGFGSAIAANSFYDNPSYKETILEKFNEVVFENDLKWPQFDSDASNDHISRALDTLEAHEIEVRGHNVIWPSYRFCPDFVEALQDDPDALQNVINDRIDDVTSFTSGRLNDWDVINEPYSEHDLQDILGDQVMADWFKRVRINDRGVKLYLNDYSILSAGGKNLVKQDYYYNLVRYIDSLGGGVQGIGLQGHFSSELTSISKVYEILEKFAELGKDIKITEFDVDTDQRGVQADYTRDFMTILFSHPSVKSLLTWGFWEGRHWRPDAALYNEDWTLRPHGEAWMDLVFNQWWTEAVDTLSDPEGIVSFDGFLGTYKYTVSLGEEIRTGTFTLDSSHQTGIANQVLISLDGSLPEQVKIAPSRSGYLCQGEEVTLRASPGSAAEYTWLHNGEILPENSSQLTTGMDGTYRVILSVNGEKIDSADYELEVRPSPISTILVEGETALCPGESVLLQAEPMEGETLDWLRGSNLIGSGISEFLADVPGTYRLVTTRDGCGVSSEPVEVTVGPILEVGVEAVGALEICEGEDVLLRTDPIPGQVYTWQKGDSTVKENDFRLTVTGSGDYSVYTVKDGCVSRSEVLSVEVSPVPVSSIEFTGESTFCEGTTLTLSSSSEEGTSYLWKQGQEVLDQTGPSLEVLEGGSYTLITSIGGCASESEPVILVLLSASDPECATGIRERSTSHSVFPNPFYGACYLQLNNPSGPGAWYCLYDAHGRLATTEYIDPGTSQIRVTTNNPGIYLLKVCDRDQSQSFRITSL